MNSIAKGQFQQTSLRRFELNALAGSPQTVQEVTDKNVAAKIDEVVRAINKKFNPVLA